jgi:hypothetical protein
VTDRTGSTNIPGGVSREGALGRVLPMGLAVRTAPSARPPDTTAEVTVKKLLTWLALAFVVFYVISAPEDSADFVRTAGQALGNAASSLASFFDSLA